MINGRYLTSVNLPFGDEFLNDIKESKILEKKPVLRLQCKNVPHSPTSPTLLQDPLSLFVDSSFELQQYTIKSQLSLLYLSKVRELDLVPVNIKFCFFFWLFNTISISLKDDIRDAVNMRSSAMWDCGQAFDLAILSELSSHGSLSNLFRLDILLSREDISRNLWKDFMPAMVNLVELNITVLERKAGLVGFTCYVSFNILVSELFRMRSISTATWRKSS